MKNNLLLNLLIVFVLLFIQSVNAQKLSIKYDQEQKIDIKSKVNQGESGTVLTADEEYYYEKVEQQKLKDSKKIVVNKISKSDGRKVWEKQLALDYYADGGSTRFCGMEKVANGFIVFMKRENSTKKISYLTTQLFDENFTAKGAEKTVNESGYLNDGRSNPFVFNIQRKGNLFLVYGSYYFVNDLKNKPISFSLIDDQQNIIWEQNIEFQKNQIFSIKSAQLMEDTSLCAIFNVSTNGKSIKDDKATVEYRVAHYNPVQKNLKMHSINLGNYFKYFGDELLNIDTVQKKIMLSGQYHKTMKGKGYEGVFNLQLNLATMESQGIQMIPFTKPMLERITSKTDFKKGNLPSDYVLKNVLTTPQNDKIFYLEYQFIQFNQSPNSTITTTEYIYKTVLLIKTNSKGELIWFNTIDRSARSTFSTYIKSDCYILDKNIVVLFNVLASSAKDPSKTDGYLCGNNNVLMVMVYDMNGKLVASDQFVPSNPEGINCNMKSIDKIDDKTLKVSFERSSNSYKLESTISGKITLE